MRIRAAVEALPYKNPKLLAIAAGYMKGEDFAAMLERALERSASVRPPKLIELKPRPANGVARWRAQTGSVRAAEDDFMQIPVLERLLAFRLPGMVTVRRLLRGPSQVTLVRRKTVDGLVFALDPESFLDGFILTDGY